MNQGKSILGHFLIWRVKNISQKNFILLLSLVVGLLSGLSAVLLKNTIHYTAHLLTFRFDIQSASFLYLLYPLIGILLTVLFVKYFVKDDISHGVTKVLFSISKKESVLRKHQTFTSIIGSSLTIGFGGSVGAEAPVVLTGAAIGSNLGRMFRMNYKTITLLLGCGAAGAIASIFKAPIAGIIFTLEVLMLDLTMASLIPLLISAVSGASIAYLLMGEGEVLSYTGATPFSLNNIPYYIFLGLFAGFISLYFTRGNLYIERKLRKIQNPYTKLFIGGTLLSILIFFVPALYGEGYDKLVAILSGKGDVLVNNSLFYGIQNNFMYFMAFLLFMLVAKVVTMSLTTGSGGVGGIFAPTLFMGGITGFFVAKLINILPFAHVPESNFALAGMAGVMSGVMHAPLTAIFLIAEITGGYGLFIPLMITSTISYLTIIYFEPHSIYTKKLADKGELITHNKDKAVLTLMKLGKVIETDFAIVNENIKLGDLVNVIAKSNRNIFPVVDNNEHLIGIVYLDHIRHVMFNRELYDKIIVHNLMIASPALIDCDESMEDVLRKFEETAAWNLPVIEKGKYIGFVSKSKIFSAYRKVLMDFSDE